jgi:hypothetical protein
MLLTSGTVQAASVLNQNNPVTAIPDGAIVFDICGLFRQCRPEDVQTILLPIGGSNLLIKNDTEYAFTKLIFTILPLPGQEELVWDTASYHGFFNNTKILEGGKTLVFSDGLFPVGATIEAIRSAPIETTYTSAFEGTPAAAIPEPTFALGILATGVLGGLLKRNR